MYFIDTNSKIPLHIQLYESLKEDIISNYQINEKIPSIRKIANTYNLSKNTVESAFSQLVVEGYIDSYPKSGYIVTDTNYKIFSFKKNVNLEIKNNQKKEEILYDFFPARLQKETFPLKLWKRLFNKVINETIDFGNYSQKQGEENLRIQIANYLNHSRAVKCTENQIILGNGFTDSLGIIALMLNDTHSSFAIENPGYYIARKIFENHKYKINKIDIDKNGIKLENLKESKSKLVYITPSHQYPTGVVMPITNRLKLLEWAKNEKAYIIEDDYDSELSYENRPIPSLQGLDNDDRVIYIGTFSKALSPAIRISYTVLPKHLLEIYNQNFLYNSSKVCLMTQKTLEKFMEEGHWDRHIRKIRMLNKKKHNLMKKLLEEKLKNTIKIESKGGGLSININPTVTLDWQKLEVLAKKEKMKLYYAKERCGDEWQALMMGFGGLKENEIEKAINTFSIIWHKSLNI